MSIFSPAPAPKNEAARDDPAASSVTTYTFGVGPLGLELNNVGGLIRADADPGGQAESMGMTQSYVVVGLNGTDLPAGCTKDELVSMIVASSRPLTLQVRSHAFDVADALNA